MKNTYETVYQTLHPIYEKHRRKYRGNPDSKQMCCMWSTWNPPDVIEGTAPFRDIEAAFGIQITDDDALDLYDMNLDEAARKIMAMREGQS
ncbi:MAG: hypothetical protein FJ278_13130 [Planctomycetes bacterium]|nr:hypothetical protein [Planctomycetota bacterium]